MAMNTKAITNKFTLKIWNCQVAFQSSDEEKCKAMTQICSKILNYPCDIQPYTQIVAYGIHTQRSPYNTNITDQWCSTSLSRENRLTVEKHWWQTGGQFLQTIPKNIQPLCRWSDSRQCVKQSGFCYSLISYSIQESYKFFHNLKYSHTGIRGEGLQA